MPSRRLRPIRTIALGPSGLGGVARALDASWAARLAPPVRLGVRRLTLGGHKKRPRCGGTGASNKWGSDLLSHPVSRAVPSAQEGLTSLFGMGRGVSPPPTPPQFHILD